jgi:hypothetical protein
MYRAGRDFPDHAALDCPAGCRRSWHRRALGCFERCLVGGNALMAPMRVHRLIENAEQRRPTSFQAGRDQDHGPRRPPGTSRARRRRAGHGGGAGTNRHDSDSANRRGPVAYRRLRVTRSEPSRRSPTRRCAHHTRTGLDLSRTHNTGRGALGQPRVTPPLPVRVAPRREGTVGSAPYRSAGAPLRGTLKSLRSGNAEGK